MRLHLVRRFVSVLSGDREVSEGTMEAQAPGTARSRQLEQ